MMRLSPGDEFTLLITGISLCYLATEAIGGAKATGYLGFCDPFPQDVPKQLTDLQTFGNIDFHLYCRRGKSKKVTIASELGPSFAVFKTDPQNRNNLTK